MKVKKMVNEKLCDDFLISWTDEGFSMSAEGLKSLFPMSKLERVALRNAGHIKQPLTLDEILDEIESDDYSTDLMLQHLLLYIAK